MSRGRSAALALPFILGWSWSAIAQVGCVPNPNLLGPPFVDGCPLPAAALNHAFTPPMSFIDNKTGAIVADAAALTVASRPAPTAQQVYNQAVFSGSGTIFNGYDSVRGVVVANASSNVNTITGVAGYSINNTVPIGQRSQTAAIFGVGVCAVDSSNCWGIDTIVSDNPTLSNTGVTTGTGKFLFNEFDLNITSPHTQGAALQVGGTALPTSVTLAVSALTVQKLWGAGGFGTGTALFSNGVFLYDACCAIGLNLGAMATSGSMVAGMPMYLNYRDGAGNGQNVTISAGSDGAPGTGYVGIGGTAGGSLAAFTGLEAGGVGALLLQGDIALKKGTNSATGPGVGYLKIEVVAGTGGGTCKLVAFAGTSTTPVTIVDNVGAGC